MHKISLTTISIVTAAALVTIASVTTRNANAVPFGDPSGIRTAIDGLSLVDEVQYYWGGRRYCWYNNAWRGAGWYRCGYAWRRGIGWGGPYGWRGWGGGVGRYGRVGRYGGRYVAGGRVGRVGGVRAGGVRVGGARVGGARVGGGRVGGARVGGGRVGGGGGGGGRRSDIMLKHDIRLLGYLDNGLGYYRFSYNGSNKAYVGVMAQEVRSVLPEAVVRGKDGYLRVFYDKLGVKFQTYRQWITSGAHVPTAPRVARPYS